MPGKVGFIGLGNMGGPMALNLAKAGFSLVVHDIDPRKLDPQVAAGASIESSPAAVAGATDRTICMVETTDQSEAVIIGEQGIITRAQAGHIVLCMSTIDPFAARRFERRLAERGIAMLDAPVSGGTVRAKSGELSIIVGGAAETYAACEDLFRAMGKSFTSGRSAMASHEAAQQHARPDPDRGDCRGAGLRRSGRARPRRSMR